MAFTRELLPEGIWCIEISGVVKAQDSISNLLEIPEIHMGDNLFSIVIYSDDVIAAQGAKDRKKIRVNMKKVLKTYRKVVIAFVANADLNFGHTRQICSELEDESIIMNVFRTEQAATEWIREMIVP